MFDLSKIFDLSMKFTLLDQHLAWIKKLLYQFITRSELGEIWGNLEKACPFCSAG